MSFQKCPICNGTGDNPFIVTGSFSSYPCPTCKGARIISEVTGLPPIIEEKHSLLEPLDEHCMADHQSFFSCTKIDTQPRYNYCSDQPTQTPTQDVSNISCSESPLSES